MDKIKDLLEKDKATIDEAFITLKAKLAYKRAISELLSKADEDVKISKEVILNLIRTNIPPHTYFLVGKTVYYLEEVQHIYSTERGSYDVSVLAKTDYKSQSWSIPLGAFLEAIILP
jgi:hypothetical protein